MSHVSSVSNGSYPYRGTLARLDANGDGVLSGEERQAGERPGILAADTESSASALGGLIAKLMQLPSADAASTATSPQSSTTSSIDLLSPMDAYNNTYGQYDVGGVAA